MAARILVIEDHPTNLQLMEYLFHAFGHEVIAAMTGPDGVQSALQHLPDLIVCDIQLPDMDGFGVIGRLKSEITTRTIPTIAITAYAMAGDKKRMLEAGFDGYLSKPINPESFIGDVEAYLPRELRGSVRPTTSAGAQKTKTRRRPRGRRILAVDDSKANLGVLRAVLEPAGYEVIPARSPAQALKLAQAEPPDLVISDVHMEGGGGFELIRTLKADSGLKDVPVVFISTTVWADADRETAARLGAEAFLMRPIEPDELVSEISNVLQKDATRG